MLSYCVYDKKTTANVPGSEKTKVAKNGHKYSSKYNLSSNYTPWLIQTLNNPLILRNNGPLTLPNLPNKSIQRSPPQSKKIPYVLPPAKLSLRKQHRPARRRKKKLPEADIIIANNQLKKAEAAAAADPPAAEPPTADPPTRNVLTTTQWLSVVSIFISVVGIYYKREEIKKV